MGFKVMSEQCNECLFSANKIVSNKRRKELLDSCLKEDRHFVCHKATLSGGQDICCHAFYEQMGQHVNLVRIAERLNAVEFVNETELK